MAFLPGVAGNYYFYSIMSSVVSLNIGLAVFNLIPVPPLDGSRVLTYFLPFSAAKWVENNGNMLYMIMLLAVFTGTLSRVITPVASVIFGGLDWIAYHIVAIFV